MPHSVGLTPYSVLVTTRSAEPDAISALRARQAEELAELRRNEIIVAASRLFAEQGYHATGIADIARALDIGHGTVYRYFENKRAILDRIVDDLVAGVLVRLLEDEPPDAATTIEEFRGQAERLIGALWDAFDADVPGVRLLLSQGAGVDGDLVRRAGTFVDEAAKVVGRYLRNGQERGFVRPDLDPRAAGQWVVALVLGSFLIRGYQERPRRDAYTTQAIDLAFRAFVAQS